MVTQLPKKFRDACDLIRNGQTEEGLQALAVFKEKLAPQVNAVLAEIHYFKGEWEKALDYDLQVLPFWDEWHYSNVRTEHLAAMVFAARVLKKENIVRDAFNHQILALQKNQDLADHLKRGQIVYYENMKSYLDTGEISHFSEKEQYKVPESILTEEEIIAALRQRDKKFDLTKHSHQSKFLFHLYDEAKPEAVIAHYQKMDSKVPLSLAPLILVVLVANYLENRQVAEEVILRMTREKLWFVASPTQVRPMDFFTHPSIFQYLKEKTMLEQIETALVVRQ